MKNGIAEKSLGMAQNQTSAKNFRIPPFLQARKATDFLAVLQKFLHDLLLSG